MMDSILWITDNTHHSKKDCEKLGFRSDNIIFIDICRTDALDSPPHNISLLIIHITDESVSSETISILSDFFEDLLNAAHCIILIPINFLFSPIKSNNTELIQTAIMYENTTVIAHSQLINHTQSKEQFNQDDKKFNNLYLQPISFQTLRTLINCVNHNNYGHKILQAVGKNHITVPQKSIYDLFSSNKIDTSLRKYITPRKIDSTIIDTLIEQKPPSKSSISLPMEVQ